MNRTYLGFVVKGLEEVAGDEVSAGRPGIEMLEVRPKLLRFRLPGAPAWLRELRCLDDVAIQVGEPFHAATREELSDAVAAEAFAGAVQAALADVEKLRPVGAAFSVTASVARSPVGRGDVLSGLVAAAVQQATGRAHWAERRAPVDVRVFADGPFVVVGLRLFEGPLGHRAYRVAGQRGGLRATAAAAMVRIAAGPSSTRVWDPFCGSGTILCEAVLQGRRVAGSDIEAAAVRATIDNLRAIGGPLVADSVHDVVVADALSSRRWATAPPGDVLVTNLPWGKQVPVARRTAFFRTVGRNLAAYSERHQSFAILTTDPDIVLREARRTGLDREIQVRRLGMAGQTPSVIFVPGQ